MIGSLMPVWIALGIATALAFFMTPTLISFLRDHQYKYIIMALNVTGVLWIVAFIWGLFPDNKTYADPLLGAQKKEFLNSLKKI